MVRNILISPVWLTAIAVVASLVFCITLTMSGISSATSILAGRSDYYEAYFSGFTPVRALVNTAYICLGILYVIWFFQKKTVALKLQTIVKYARPFLVLAFIAYPQSTDVYLYLQYGLMGLNKINPYLNPANSFNSVVSPLIEWSQTSTYGPITQLFFMAAAWVAPISPILGVYLFKLFCLAIHVSNACLVWRLLGASAWQNKLTMAYLMNPILLNEHVVNAHVDVYLCNVLLILMGCLFNRFYIESILVGVAGFLTKTLPLIWLPLMVGFLVYRRRWRELAIAALLSAGVIIFLSYTLLPTVEAWKSLLNPGVKGLTARSIHHLFNIALGYLTGFDLQQRQGIISNLSLLTTLGFFGYYAWTLLLPKLKPNYSEVNLAIDIGWTTLVLFLFATPWLMPWYPTILLPIAIVCRCRDRFFFLTSFTFSLSLGIIYGTGGGQSLLSAIASLTSIGPAIALILLRKQAISSSVAQKI
ncbi:MAG TPA: hypothetical protein DDW76_32025 [Cyanobacteria bacterium UBA11369]|nr:hypothetical protein [Cyanobacteria bacterium UBA11371]HBE32937.1 hypothetical protein [Cyanobacteria bacterium UBA11368]HBE53270.1 hypothetical protein [Cyanobacteria bacterium UBA11369]